MLTVTQLQVPDSLITYINKRRQLLTRDVSSYATGRLRGWIGVEAPLSDNQPFRPAPFGYKDPLWCWLYQQCVEKLDFTPEVGLLHVGGADCSDPEVLPEDGNGGECGIKTHRDASYADFRAVGINLQGEATFGYRAYYPYQDRWSQTRNDTAPTERVSMTRGTCVLFNCNNPHFAQVGPNRWAVNLWRISEKRRADFDLFTQQSVLEFED